MARRTGIALILVALLLSGGSGFAQESTPHATPGTSPDLTTFVWELVEMQTGPDASATPDDPTQYTVRFFDDGTLAVMADCNAARGDYTADGGSIDITMGAMTLVLCPEGSLSDQFVADLDQAARFVFNDAGDLVIWLPADAGFLRFQPSLTGVIWQWTELEMSDGATITPEDPFRYTLEFYSEQQLAVGADCNRGVGASTRTGSQLNLNIIVVTEAMCLPGSLSEDYLTYLNDVVSVTFADGQMHLALAIDSGILSFSPLPYMPTEITGTPEA